MTTEHIINGDFTLTVADAGGGNDPASWNVTETGGNNASVIANNGSVGFNTGNSTTGEGSIEQTITGLNIGQEATLSLNYFENGNNTSTTNGDAAIRVELVDSSNTVIFTSDITTANTYTFPSFTVADTSYTIRISDISTGSGVALDPRIDDVSFTTICFAKGTKIETIKGKRPIEKLETGDWVKTLDSGYKQISWIGCSNIKHEQLKANPNLYPVRITKGALGGGLPKKDLVVSQQHRMLIRSINTILLLDRAEVLVPAIKLAELEGINIEDHLSEVYYYHMLFDRHEIVFANDAPSESLYTGEQALKSISQAAKDEIKAIFPEIFEAGSKIAPAREFMDSHYMISTLINMHANDKRPLTS